MVTGRALAREYSSSSDTLYLHADTIRTLLVITPSKALNDSVTLPADTTHHIVAAPHVRFFRTDLQGLCDSMTFVQRDSMMYMNYHPVVWNENKQIFGNIIEVHMNDSTADWARLPDFAFTAEWIDEEFYSQLSGKEMVAKFDKGELRHLDVSGNVMAIFLPVLYVLYILRSNIQGLGDTVLPMVSGFAEFGMRVVAALVLPLLVGQTGIFYAEILAWIGADVVLVWAMLKHLKNLRRLERN